MKCTVKLSDLLAAYSGSPDRVTFVDRETGRMIAIDGVLFREAKSRRQSTEEYADWQSQELELARTVVADRGRRFIPGPKPADFPEYQTMQDYIAALNDRSVAFDLSRAIKARGAFRQFKEGVTYFGLRDDWFQFRDEALVLCARRWARTHAMELDETSPSSLDRRR